MYVTLEADGEKTSASKQERFFFLDDGHLRRNNNNNNNNKSFLACYLVSVVYIQHFVWMVHDECPVVLVFAFVAA